MNVLLLGGTRFLGRRVAALLLERGATVSALHRGVTADVPADVMSILGDRTQIDGLRGLGDARFDAVVDLSAYFSEWTERALELLADRTAHYVFVSSGAVYHPSAELPWPETTPYGPIPLWGRYGAEKVQSERLLWQAYAERRCAVTMFRFPFILGPGNFADRESFVFSRLQSGRPILLPNGGKALNQFVYVDDAASAIVAALVRRDVAAGTAYNCAYPTAITNRGWVELCASVLGVEPNIVAIDEHALGIATDTVDLTDIVFPYPSEHYMLDPQKLIRELGVKMETGNLRMLEEYAAWWATVPDHKPRRYEREDAALASLSAQ